MFVEAGKVSARPDMSLHEPELFLRWHASPRSLLVGLRRLSEYADRRLRGQRPANHDEHWHRWRSGLWKLGRHLWDNRRPRNQRLKWLERKRKQRGEHRRRRHFRYWNIGHHLWRVSFPLPEWDLLWRRKHVHRRLVLPDGTGLRCGVLFWLFHMRQPAVSTGNWLDGWMSFPLPEWDLLWRRKHVHQQLMLPDGTGLRCGVLFWLFHMRQPAVHAVVRSVDKAA